MPGLNSFISESLSLLISRLYICEEIPDEHMAAEKLTPHRENFSDWVNQLVLAAEMADYAAVRGCMVVRPNGWALWENLQQKKYISPRHTN